MARIHILFLLYLLWIYLFDFAVAQSGKCLSGCDSNNGNCAQCVNNKCSYWPRQGICDSTQFLWSTCRSTPGCNTDEIVSDVYDCPKTPSNSFEQNLASQMLILAAAAYGNPGDTEKCFQDRLGDFKIVGIYSTNCIAIFDKTTCYAFIAISNTSRTIAIGFRGTDGVIQLIQELETSFIKTPFPGPGIPGGGMVNAYFYFSFKNIWSSSNIIDGMEGSMLSAIQELSADYADYKLWVTGHSLGGAIASICATYIRFFNWFPANAVKLVTFGQPRTGDKTYAKLHDQLVPYSFRIVNREDKVPQVPPRAPISDIFFSSKSCCHGCGNDNNYHHSNEVWYQNGPFDNAKVCQQPESWDCSIGTFYKSCSLSDYSIYDHLCYYGRCVGDWGRHGCNNDYVCTNDDTCSILRAYAVPNL